MVWHVRAEADVRGRESEWNLRMRRTYLPAPRVT